eukprot:UN17979
MQQLHSQYLAPCNFENICFLWRVLNIKPMELRIHSCWRRSGKTSWRHVGWLPFF